VSEPDPIAFHQLRMDRGQNFELHVHTEAHQLAWASSGVLSVHVGDRCWILPPNLALWIPAGIWHTTMAVRDSTFEGVYVDRAARGFTWTEPTALSVSGLARSLLEHLAGNLEPAERARAEGVLADVLRPVQQASIELPLPKDPRAREVAEMLLADPADRRGLEQFATAVHTSSRTLLRLFLAETGLTFTQWRTHARVQAAMALLVLGSAVSRVATDVGYATPSAFVSVFRRVTGRTPAAYAASTRG
jgi:AraC-like DNA-binding protein